MHARNPRTGAAVVRSLERLSGTAVIADDTFVRNPDGSLDYDYEGTTDVHWNGQLTVTRGKDRVFIDDNGDEVLESELELVDDPSAPLTKALATAAGAAHPAPGNTAA